MVARFTKPVHNYVAHVSGGSVKADTSRTMALLNVYWYTPERAICREDSVYLPVHDINARVSSPRTAGRSPLFRARTFEDTAERIRRQVSSFLTTRVSPEPVVQALGHPQRWRAAPGVEPAGVEISTNLEGE